MALSVIIGIYITIGLLSAVGTVFLSKKLFVIEGVFTNEEKQKLIKNVTAAMVSVEGEPLREKTVVILEEVKSGNWGIGGHTLTTDDVKQLRASR